MTNYQRKKFYSGFTIFQDKIRKVLKKKQLNQIEETISMPIWKIKNLKQEKNVWRIVFSQMIESRIRHAWINNNQFSTILLQISHIKFLQLRMLELNQNGINNIQPLSFLNAPKLEFLCLKKNEIVNMENYFSKSKFDNLSKIHFQKNRIQKISKIERLSLLHKNQLSSSFQMCAQLLLQKPAHQDLSVLAKIQINKQRISCCLFFKCYQTIQQRKVLQKIPF